MLCILGKLTWEGVAYGILSSCCVSLNSIFTKKVLPWVDNSAWTLTFYNNVNASLLFIPLMILFGEVPDRIAVNQIQEPYFWLLMVVGGICGVSIGFVTAMQIKVIALNFLSVPHFTIELIIIKTVFVLQLTSPLTHNISGTAKACVQTVIGVGVYHDVKSWTWWASNWIVLLGSCLYARVQQLDMEKTFKRTRTSLA